MLFDFLVLQPGHRPHIAGIGDRENRHHVCVQKAQFFLAQEPVHDGEEPVNGIGILVGALDGELLGQGHQSREKRVDCPLFLP